MLAVIDHATEAQRPVLWARSEFGQEDLTELLERNPALATLQTSRRHSIIDLLLPIDISIGELALIRGSDASIALARQQVADLYQEACGEITAREHRLTTAILTTAGEKWSEDMLREREMLFVEETLLFQVCMIEYNFDHTFCLRTWMTLPLAGEQSVGTIIVNELPRGMGLSSRSSDARKMGSAGRSLIFLHSLEDRWTWHAA